MIHIIGTSEPAIERPVYEWPQSQIQSMKAHAKNLLHKRHPPINANHLLSTGRSWTCPCNVSVMQMRDNLVQTPRTSVASLLSYHYWPTSAASHLSRLPWLLRVHWQRIVGTSSSKRIWHIFGAFQWPLAFRILQWKTHLNVLNRTPASTLSQKEPLHIWITYTIQLEN